RVMHINPQLINKKEAKKGSTKNVILQQLNLSYKVTFYYESTGMEDLRGIFGDDKVPSFCRMGPVYFVK
ncbi:MAG: hypothetical protein D8M58_11655, partial [Calditrichaeota bacterium]